MSYIKDIIKKADIFLFIAIIAIGLAFTCLVYALGTGGDTVDITVAGEPYGSYDLSDDNEITIEQNGHTNKVIIKDGKVSMAFSDCKNQICVHQGEISDGNESITCLPNRVMITISGEGNYDATTK